MPLLSVLLSCSAALLDLAGVAFLVSRAPSAREVGVVLVAHAAVAALAAAAAQLAPPPPAARARGAFFALCLALAFFVPAAGPLGVLLVARFGLAAAPRGSDLPLVTLAPDDDDERPEPRRRVSASEIRSVLAARGDAARRFHAVLQIRRLPPDQQTELLELALKDPSDEVRLYAFSRIERMRSDLEGKIQKLERLAAADPGAGSDAALVHLRLAECLHEMAALKLAEGVVLEHALRAASDHALLAMRHPRVAGPAATLLARVLMRLGGYHSALAALRVAERAGHPREVLQPLVAECEFRCRLDLPVREAS